MEIPSPYLTLIEAAKYLRCSPVTLRFWALKKKIKGGKAGATWLFHEQDLDRFVEMGGKR
jgi:excisionase family DNA binding protein